MKNPFLSLALLLSLAACSKKDDASPAVATSTATYTDGSGAQSALITPKVYLLTATPTPYPGNRDRREISLRATLGNGSSLTVAFRYVGSALPPAGAVTLDEGPIVTNSGAGIPATQYQGAISTGSLSVDSTSPQAVSGSYTGPLTAGGPSVRVVFSKLAIQ